MKTALKFTLISLVLVSYFSPLTAGELESSSRQLLNPLKSQPLCFQYTEKKQLLYHASQPWKTMSRTHHGSIYTNGKSFMQYDTLQKGEKSFVTRLILSDSSLLFQPYWSDSLVDIDSSTFVNSLLATARYSPVMLLEYFIKNKSSCQLTENKQCQIYTLPLRKVRVDLYIEKSTLLPMQLCWTEADEMLGDVTTLCQYEEYDQLGKLQYPALIRIKRVNAICDTVKISSAYPVIALPAFTGEPENYAIQPDPFKEAVCIADTIAKGLYLLILPHTESSSAVVEFNDYLLVINAPLNSENAEMILNKAKQLAPGKTVKYFTAVM